MRAMLSSMSAMVVAGSCLEDMLQVAGDSGAETVGLHWRREDFDRVTKEAGETAFQGAEADEGDSGRGVEVGQDVDVAVLSGVAASVGAEQAQGEDAGLAEFGFVGAKGGDDVGGGDCGGYFCRGAVLRRCGLDSGDLCIIRDRGFECSHTGV